MYVLRFSGLYNTSREVQPLSKVREPYCRFVDKNPHSNSPEVAQNGINSPTYPYASSDSPVLKCFHIVCICCVEISDYTRFIHICLATAVVSFARTLTLEATSGMVLIKSIVKSSQTRVTFPANNKSLARTISTLFVAIRGRATMNVAITSIAT